MILISPLLVSDSFESKPSEIRVAEKQTNKQNIVFLIKMSFVWCVYDFDVFYFKTKQQTIWI